MVLIFSIVKKIFLVSRVMSTLLEINSLGQFLHFAHPFEMSISTCDGKPRRLIVNGQKHSHQLLHS